MFFFERRAEREREQFGGGWVVFLKVGTAAAV